MEIWRFLQAFYISGVLAAAVVKASRDQPAYFDEAAHMPGEPLTPIDYRNAEGMKDSPVIIDAFHKDPIELAGLFEGDIILSASRTSDLTLPDFLMKPPNTRVEEETRNGIIYEKQKWDKGVIPYLISSQFSAVERSTIAKAMAEYHAKTCIKFRSRSTERDYIHITKGNGCSSQVGKTGGAQQVTLGQGCVHTGIVIHELMHATGFWHEQSRADRDSFVTVYYQNIKPGMDFNFRKYSWKDIQNLSEPYDLGSVMHYSEHSFSKDRKPTILPKDKNKKIGQRAGFSKIDLLKINRLYKCQSGTTMTMTEMANVTLECIDTHGQCPTWAKQGQCQTNRPWMMANCKLSCNLCDMPCSDLNKYCGVWARSGDCKTNSHYMSNYCQRSCEICGADGPVGPSEEATASTAAPTTPVPTTPPFNCEDTEKFCKYWASHGECTKNSKFMGKYCPKSCHICT